VGSPHNITTALNEVAVEVGEDDDDIIHDLYLPHLSIALERLSLIHREVLVLRFLENMAYDDISEALGISLGTTKSRIHNAKLALRQHLEVITHE
jgi:RNA polymerase sigma-70 factor (ECF subfamily)